MFQTLVKAKYWDEFDQDEKEETFFIYSNSLNDAADQMVEWLGEECIEEITFIFGPDTILKVDDEMMNKIKEIWEE